MKTTTTASIVSVLLLSSCYAAGQEADDNPPPSDFVHIEIHTDSVAQDSPDVMEPAPEPAAPEREEPELEDILLDELEYLAAEAEAALEHVDSDAEPHSVEAEEEEPPVTVHMGQGRDAYDIELPSLPPVKSRSEYLDRADTVQQRLYDVARELGVDLDDDSASPMLSEREE